MEFGYKNIKGSDEEDTDNASVSNTSRAENSKSVYCIDFDIENITLDLKEILALRSVTDLSIREIENYLLMITSYSSTIIYLIAKYKETSSKMEINFSIWWAGKIGESESNIIIDRAKKFDELIASYVESENPIAVQTLKDKSKMLKDTLGNLSQQRVKDYLIDSNSDDYKQKKSEIAVVANKIDTLERTFKELENKGHNLRSVHKRMVEEKRIGIKTT